MVESNNDILNLLKLAITTLDSSNLTQLPPNNDSGIAVSGSTGFTFAPMHLLTTMMPQRPQLKSR
jgi:hypothetical protein